MKKSKGRSRGMRSPEVVWALNLLWIGLGNYYGSGFEKPQWLLAGAALYALSSLHLFGVQAVDPWLVGYATLSVVGHVKVRRHNEKVVAEQMRTRRRPTGTGSRAPLPAGESPQLISADAPGLPSAADQGEELALDSPVRRPAQICPSCGTPRDPLRFSCPQCAYFYDS